MTEEAATVRVTIADKQMIAQDICLFELRPLNGEPLAPFTPGAHLGITVPNGEMRKYSLCNDPDEADRYVIAVKKELGGRGGSVSLIDETQTGDEIAITPPRNDFALKPGPSSYILIAGGIGITPIRAMIKHLMATRAKPFKLYYFTRSPEMMAFRDEFMARLLGHLRLVHDQFQEELRALHEHGPTEVQGAARQLEGLASAELDTQLQPPEVIRPLEVLIEFVDDECPARRLPDPLAPDGGDPAAADPTSSLGPLRPTAEPPLRPRRV